MRIHGGGRPQRLRPRPAYVVSAVAFLALAGVRAAQGDSGWAVLFALAAMVNAWLATQPTGGQGSVLPETRPARAHHASASPATEEGPRRARSWTALAAAAAGVALGLVVVEPTFAVMAALVALAVIVHARRLRRVTRQGA
jgi:hypothetical protein